MMATLAVKDTGHYRALTERAKDNGQSIAAEVLGDRASFRHFCGFFGYGSNARSDSVRALS